MKTFLSLGFFIFITHVSFCQETISLLFAGDVMQHDSQINNALNPETGTYEYDECFDHVRGIVSAADYAIANLEGTLAGEPYKGYPQFSAPDALAEALKNAGFDALVTANNHSCDRYKQGLERTINVLDNLEIHHTGTFVNQQVKNLTYPFFFDVKGYKFALLNYTYGTNGIPARAPNIVNLISRDQILADLQKAKAGSPDKIIVFLHWGDQYVLHPNDKQVSLADFLANKGADLIIGSHPHVLQRMENEYNETLGKDIVRVYSLGNYISNQRKRYRDGGAMVQVNLTVENQKLVVSDVGYYLTWVYTPWKEGRKRWYILPADEFVQRRDEINAESYGLMQQFISDSRSLLEKENLNVFELKYSQNRWEY